MLASTDTTRSTLTRSLDEGALTDPVLPDTSTHGGSTTDRLDGAALPCWSTDPDLWFAEKPADVETAKALCAPCPLRAQCLEGALARREPWGVWGGQLVVAGVVVPRKRPRGRPRKHEVAA